MKDVQDLYTDAYEISVTYIFKDINKWREIHVHELEIKQFKDVHSPLDGLKFQMKSQVSRKSPARFPLVEIDKPVLKFIQKCKDLRRV